MDIFSLIGLLLALVALVGGSILKGAGLSSLWSSAAFVIVILGTIGGAARMDGTVIGKAGEMLDETRLGVKGLSDGSMPLLGEVTTTVATTNEQLARIDTVTTNLAHMSSNVNALTSLFAATLGGPLVKVAAFSYGVRTALGDRATRAARTTGTPDHASGERKGVGDVG